MTRARRIGCRVRGPPPLFFVSADSKGLTNCLFVSADSKGVSGPMFETADQEIGVAGGIQLSMSERGLCNSQQGLDGCPGCEGRLLLTCRGGEQAV